MPKSPSLLVRTGLTRTEWRKIQAQAKAKEITAKKHVTDTLRDALLKGAQS